MYELLDPTHRPQGHQGVGPTESLLTAKDVAAYLRVNVKRVYSLPINHVRISDRRVRYAPSDVAEYVRRSRRGA